MSHRFICYLAFVCLISIFAGSALSAEIKEIDGVTHILNDEKPANPRQDIHLKELWRVGGEDDEEILLGAIGNVISDDAGNIYLVDSQLNNVLAISPSGEYLNTLGGEGDGPGEVRSLSSAFFMPDGQLGLVQAFPGKIVTVNLDNTPGRILKYYETSKEEATFGLMIGGLVRGGTMILTGAIMSMQGPVNVQSYYLSACSPDGKMLHRFYEKDQSIDYSGYVATEIGLDFAWARWHLSPDGLLYAAPERNKYEIEVHKSDGSLAKVISRTYSSYKRSSEHMELAGKFVEAVYNNHPAPPQSYAIEETDADISGIRVKPNGELWVRSSRGSRNRPEGVGFTYDVFDQEGVFDRQAAVHGDFDPDRDLFQLIGQDRFVVVVSAGDSYLNSMGVSGGADPEAEEVPMIEVICYELR